MLPNIKIGPKEDSEKSVCHKIVNKTLWLIGTARNAIIVVAGGLFAAYFYNNGNEWFRMIGEIPAGLPPIRIPPFSIAEISNDTHVIQEAETFGSVISDLGSAIIVVPLIALLENIAICKAFGKLFYFQSFELFLIRFF